MTGVFAGDGDRLSARATFPMLPDAEQTHGGLLRAGRAARKAGASTPTALLFSTPRQGLGAMVEALAREIGPAAIRTGAGVERIERNGTGFTVHLGGGERLDAAGVILATPAGPAADLMDGIDSMLAAELREIEYVSTATVSMAVPDGAVRRPIDGHGFVLPRLEGSPIVGCTITSTKFPHRAPAGWTLVRVFVGRAGQPDALRFDDAVLIDLARQELSRSLGIEQPPSWAKVFRWPDAIPQYNVGHLARVARIEQRAGGAPGGGGRRAPISRDRDPGLHRIGSGGGGGARSGRVKPLGCDDGVRLPPHRPVPGAQLRCRSASTRFGATAHPTSELPTSTSTHGPAPLGVGETRTSTP